MEHVAELVKNYSLVFLLMSICGAMAAGKRYQQYIRFFAGLLLMITLLVPVIAFFGKADDFSLRLSAENFWQGIEQIQMEEEKLEFLDSDGITGCYEAVIGEDVGQMAQETGYLVTDICVEFDTEYQVTSIRLVVADETDRDYVRGSIREEPENDRLRILREKIAACYRIEPEDVVIRS